ncbi:aldehyde dehydrogenase family protein [Pseudomonas syringae]|uniref:aldehyde dehydrogenase family protein n=1 Tax=Pseudomonas syringae TaxID=317 RepID=UPI001F18DE17|nr:aldehyde dehydrogenase family protein [Pseudomonas syringae]
MIVYNKFFSQGNALPCSGESGYDVVSPVLGRTVGRVTFASLSDVEVAIHSAKEGLRIWSQSSLSDRKKALSELLNALSTRGDDIAEALALEIGCPKFLGQSMQLGMATKGIELAIEGIDQITWEEMIGNGRVQRVGTGIVAALTPWNFPLHQIVAKVAAVIAAGCSVVLKPSEVSPGVAEIFAECVAETSLPAGVFNMVWGGADVGEYLVSHPDINHVSFTGSSAVGKAIMVKAAESLKRLTLELGGKSAAVVLEDADLDIAIPHIVRMSLANSGQTCVSQSRVIVPRKLIGEITERYLNEAKQWKLGDPCQSETRLGPVANEKQYRHVQRMIQNALNAGADVQTAGNLPVVGFENGYFVAPTVVSNVDATSEIAQQEIFGPVVCLLPYDTKEEAIEIANSTKYGLSGAVWSRDLERANKVANQLQTGQVIINGAPQNLATPFGGWKDSGFGRENGKYGIEDLLVFRSIQGG